MRRSFSDKFLAPVLLMALCATTLFGCGKVTAQTANADAKTTGTSDALTDDQNATAGSKDGQKTQESGKTDTLDTTMQINEQTTYQTFEGFGASSCWWSQYVGGWDNVPEGDTLSVREQIAKLLYSKEEGIGLSIYRYNVGAGSADTGTGDISDPHRRAESFLTAEGTLDFTKDENARWFLAKSLEEGAEQVILFCNSPQVSMTRNGFAHMDEGSSDNLDPEKYDDFADYVFDVAEHFLAEGVPVTSISPINEPQWEWVSGQEGCHYTPEALRDLLKVFVEKVQERGLSEKLTITSPEGGEWKSSTENYIDAMLSDPELAEYFTVIDGHSYWSDKATKMLFMQWMEKHYPGVQIAMSEWCEMVNGRDYTMDSAYNLADQIWEDLTVLNAVSWQYWVAVADGDYRDGLIYVNVSDQSFEPNRRLYAMGNYSRFIRPGFVRCEITDEALGQNELKPVCFTGTSPEGKKQTVCVFINRGDRRHIGISGDKTYSSFEIYTTTQEDDLIKTGEGNVTEDTVYELAGNAIVTVIFTE